MAMMTWRLMKLRNSRTSFFLRRLFTLAVITASFGICFSLAALLQQAAVPQITHGLQQQREDERLHTFAAD